jgi:hypothetical protein
LTPVEAARLREAGFTVSNDNTARATDASVEIVVDDDDVCTVTIALLPGDGSVRLQFSRASVHPCAETSRGLPH